MARCRFIRPEFFTDEKLGELPFGARLLFAALWCHSDLRGVFEHSPKQLRVLAFPFDEEVTSGKVQDWLTTLETLNLIARFEARGKLWGFVVNWSKHQQITGRERDIGSTRPAPPERSASDEHSKDRSEPVPGTRLGHDRAASPSPSPSPSDTPTPTGQLSLGKSWESQIQIAGGEVAKWNVVNWAGIIERAGGVGPVIKIMEKLEAMQRVDWKCVSDAVNRAIKDREINTAKAKKINSENVDNKKREVIDSEARPIWAALQKAFMALSNEDREKCKYSVPVVTRSFIKALEDLKAPPLRANLAVSRLSKVPELADYVSHLSPNGAA